VFFLSLQTHIGTYIDTYLLARQRRRKEVDAVGFLLQSVIIPTGLSLRHIFLFRSVSVSLGVTGVSSFPSPSLAPSVPPSSGIEKRRVQRKAKREKINVNVRQGIQDLLIRVWSRDREQGGRGCGSLCFQRRKEPAKGGRDLLLDSCNTLRFRALETAPGQKTSGS
jgi:hypothetical protein